MEVTPFSVTKELLIDRIDALLQAVIRLAQGYFGGNFAYLKITVGTVLISLLTVFPFYYKDLHNGMSGELHHPSALALSYKVQHPLSPIPSSIKDTPYVGAASHIDKLELRLTLPILGWLSGTGVWTVIIWNHFSALVVFFLLAHLANQAVGDLVSSALFVLGVGATFFGSWFFNDIYFGDGVAYLFLLLSVASRYPALSFCSFLVAAFCDERCVAAGPLLCLYFFVSHRQDGEKALRLKQCIAIVAAAGAWMLLRIWLAGALHLVTGTSQLMTREILINNFGKNLPGTFLGVFKASWTLPVVGLFSLVSRRKWASSWLFLGAFSLAAAPAFVVYDFERSLSYTFVVLLISLHFLWGDKKASRKYLAAVLVANLLLTSPLYSVLRIGQWLL